jgi:hypothetical protein
MSDEEKIRLKVGKENPFKVPEGYFEVFQQRLLSSLPERPSEEIKPTRIPVWRKARPWLSAAAMLVGVVILIAALRQTNVLNNGAMASNDETVFTEEEMDYLASSVFDDYTLYSYLTNEEWL